MSIKTNLNVDSNIAISIPKMYKVIIHNDDYTPQDYVVLILKGIFNKETTSAIDIMLKIHNSGKGIVGTYSYDIAMTKKILADNLSKENQYPLKITLEEAIE